MRKIIVTCDDYGLSEGINNSAVQLYKEGLINAVSTFVNFPYFSSGVELINKHNISAGVHLNLSDGKPLSIVSHTLTNKGGKFQHKYLLFAKSIFPSKQFIVDAKVELERQIEHCIQHNIALKHLTTHCQFHAFPIFNKMLVDLAKKYRVEWIRNPYLTKAILPIFPSINFKTSNTKLHVKHLDYIVPIKYWLNTSPRSLAQKINGLIGGVEVVIHASTKSDKTFPDKFDYLPAQRHREVVYLRELVKYLEK